MPNPSIGPITVDLPSPPVVASNVAGYSTHATTEFQDKGKEVEGSRKRKSPMMSGHSSSPLKSAKKGRKRVKATRNMKPKVFMESEDEEDSIVQPISSGVPALNLPQPSTIVVGTPHSPRSPHSPKKQLFGPASLIAGSPPKVMATSGSRPEVVKTPQAMSSTPAEEPPVIDTEPTEQPLPLLHPGELALHHLVGQEDPCPVFVTRSRTPSRAPSNAPAALQSKDRTHSQSRGPSGTPAVPAVTTPKAQSRGRSKTITAAKTPAPAPASIPSSSAAVPRPALNVPMPGLHSMAIAIWDGATRIALLEARVVEQDVIDQHPSFPLPDSPVNATFLLDQSVPLSISPLPSALAPLIDLDMAGMEPPSPKVQDASAIESLIFEPSQIQPEGPQTSSKIVDPDDLGNLVPEYNSDDMDVEVKVEPSGDEVEMAT
ncbi:hypothetical protein BDR07DRAFT_1482176 [Suillus spraguei]|nr:hypothetical protein BDR07DRAFT_1482176 [Suillus spraguei]